ncbi:class II D-tagatose-bisphosphate aldolase, non-catalytic subunit [Agrobacterium rhizogenes]|nr:class II D-tagatose-bisphosphate aldolase, non-catalytic subunit [Rhizobium rhizogenes]OCJ17364.1 tagatose-bisphosphate aldolase [Agrobacterium sp. B131/95]OCJ28504.1 tagatose-bisphosphate aldolase [Agrobacterium sp. B133/95]NTI46313.1 class II D-tagatose-bisphosphate aldolase, non-catalytic subunit [Rhizobium rhizogenes]NTI52997.1 class II D-tagatose-bisphosphate aldolase, non-catalytic subunit [Rhizobium rhizogenes]NTI98370.1 class II D-tagatose-bisphosphate aldolase, non-catalytic subuni
MSVNLSELARNRTAGGPAIGVTSVCSAHPLVLRAALRYGRDKSSTVLIEATCNQVNHLGGYTGMTPSDFAALVFEIADDEQCPRELIVLGGDHLGPNPWRDLPAEAALAEAMKMVSAYVEAGFRKIHLDASMGCKGEPAALDDETTAHRAARLASAAEEAASRVGGGKPIYIIGTEVPPPGGADHALSAIEPTAASAARKTIDVHRKVFADAGLGDAFTRAIGLVVQPGVEFGNHNVIVYNRSRIDDLRAVLDAEPQFVFEAHSTDYQGGKPLRELVEDGFPILKVGPELTFVLREALYALDLIASDLLPAYGQRPLYSAMEALLIAQPSNWSRHYHGTDAEKRWLRHYSLSDRIRYYWATPEARDAVGFLFESLEGVTIPMPLMWQHMPAAMSFADAPLTPEELVMWRITKSLADYDYGCTGSVHDVAD